MAVVSLQVFVSVILVLGSAILYAVSVKQGDSEHADRLSLLPLEDEIVASEPSSDANGPARKGARDRGA
jgi:hypothetical protein